MTEEWILNLHNAKKRKQWDDVGFWAKIGLHDYPLSTYLYESLGESLERKGQVEEAIKCYERCRAIALSGRDRPRAKFFKRLDLLYRRLEQYDKCFDADFSYAFEYSISTDAWHRLGRIARMLGYDEISIFAEEMVNELNSKVIPLGADEPLPPVPEVEDIIDDAINHNDYPSLEWMNILDTEASIGEEADKDLLDWNEAGFVRSKRWVSVNDEFVCPACRELDGVEVDINRKYAIGSGIVVDSPPAHDDCRCWLMPIFTAEGLAREIRRRMES